MTPSLRTQSERARPASFRSLSTKFFVFTASLLFWVVFTFLAFDLRQGHVDWVKWALGGVLVFVAAAGLSRFTIKLLARPLLLLEEGIQSVGEGRLEPIQVSNTRDEIEFLGNSFNHMIDCLNASRNEVRQNQELLEERIRIRTEELEHAMQRAQAASQAKSEFLANMSHELRTPMNGVLGMIDIVLDGPLTAEQREQLETSQRCANSLLSLLNDILDLSKIEAGKMVLERIPFDIRALIDEAVRAHRPRATHKGITVSVDVAHDVPRRITADPLRIRQILSNLLSNAMKFTERGSVKVRVLRLPQTSGHELAFEVSDTGVGIPADKLSCIFEKFTQADGSITRKYGGTGLGLAITRKLVDMHEGRITVESEPGKGSTFRVCLPSSVCHEQSPAGAEPPIAEFSGLPPSSDGNGPAILVVEDNHVNQKVVTAILRKRGYHVDVANHGREALEYLDLLAYSLILMDVQMPILDGLETTRVIRRDKRFANLPIVAMTAHAMSGDRERCLAAGMNGYLAKPLNPTTLVRVVEEFVTQSHLPASHVQDSGRKEIDAAPEVLLGRQRTFLQATPPLVERLHACLHEPDLPGLIEEANQLSLSAEKIGAARVAAAARSLEQSAAARDLDALRKHLVTVEHELEIASRGLARSLQTTH